jgi:hypothetical protein
MAPSIAVKTIPHCNFVVRYSAVCQFSPIPCYGTLMSALRQKRPLGGSFSARSLDQGRRSNLAKVID